MSSRFLWAVLLCVCFLEFSCQSKKVPPSDYVSFLDQNPVIDGKLDPNLRSLPKREFPYIWQFDNPVTDTITLSYRLAYTPTHLYVYTEAEADSITYRRRGFVNGDGYKLLLAMPKEDSLTDEYYDMLFSPSQDPEYWARKMVANYNFKQVFRPLGSESRVQEAAYEGKSGFEALIAWKDIPPYHPWFIDEMGFNLYFAKGIGDTITNGYAVVPDEGIWDEEIPKRQYHLLTFEEPAGGRKSIQVQPKRLHVRKGESLVVHSATLGPLPEETHLEVRLYDEFNEKVYQGALQLKGSSSFSKSTKTFNPVELAPGIYQLFINTAQDTLFYSNWVVFPQIDFEEIRSEIEANAHGLSSGTMNTLLFKLDQRQAQMLALKPYESGKEVFESWRKFKVELDSFRAGVDPYQGKGGPYRRAFQSSLDESLQPYSLKLPAGYDPQKKYPLLVFLHGSGQDDQGLLDSPRSNGEFIEIAPFARDKFRAYTSAESQIDIVDAINDVAEQFSVDREKIVIGGFSMGGYGCLRAFYEYPDLYRGVAVFAGRPDLASYWLEGEYPNFMDVKYLAPFSGIPVFVYHGREDGSLPVSLAEKMIRLMEENGAQVTSSLVEEKGHEYPDPATNERYFNWLQEIVK
jgi:predicted esterase